MPVSGWPNGYSKWLVSMPVLMQLAMTGSVRILKADGCSAFSDMAVY